MPIDRDASRITACALALFAAACGGASSTPPVDAAGDGDAPIVVDAPAGDGPTAIDAPLPATDPAMPGTYRSLVTATVQIPVANGNIAGTVCAPSLDGTTPAPGPFPLVVVSPGFQLARAQYRYVCDHLATWGFIAITRDYAASGNHTAKAAEVGRVIDWATGAASGLAARVDATRIATAGHSLGGKVSIHAAILDPRVRAVVGWDAVDALPPFGNDGSVSVAPELMGGLRVPIALLGETTDASGGVGGMSCAPAADNYTQFYRAACAATAALEVTIAGADHMDWIGDRASCGFACFACQSGTLADATVHELTRRVTVAWLARHLRGELAMDTWLAAPGIGTPTTLRAGVPAC